MTQAATPRQADTALTSVESELLYEVVDGHIVAKDPVGAYEILVGSFLTTRLDSFARVSDCGRAVSAMLFDFGPGLPQRRPDVAYVSYDRWPRKLTGEPFLPGFRLQLSELFDVEAMEA